MTTTTRAIPSSASDYERWNRRRMETINAQVGNLAGRDCPACKNRGYLAKVNSLGELMVEECGCMAVRRAEKAARESGMGPMLDRYSLDNFQTPEPWQKGAVETARRFAAREDRDGWFLISGCPGAGKTHLCAGICKALLDKGIPVRYFLWREEGRELKAIAKEKPEYEKIMKELTAAPALYVDDFLKAGNQKISDGDINLAIELVNRRYMKQSGITIFSSELSMKEILDADQAMGSRIYHRVGEFSVQIDGKKNWRMKGEG